SDTSGERLLRLPCRTAAERPLYWMVWTHRAAGARELAGAKTWPVRAGKAVVMAGGGEQGGDVGGAASSEIVWGHFALWALNLCIGDLIAAIREPDCRSRTGNEGAVWTIAQPLLHCCNLAAPASTLSSGKRLSGRGNWPNQDHPGEHGSQYIRPHIIGPPYEV